MTTIDRFLNRFQAASIIVLFAAMVGDLAVTVYYAPTESANARDTGMLIAMVLGALQLMLLIGTVGRKRRN